MTGPLKLQYSPDLNMNKRIWSYRRSSQIRKIFLGKITTSKFLLGLICNSCSLYQSYMVTLRALTESSPFGTKPQEPWQPKRARCDAKPVPLSSSTAGKCAPLQSEDSQNKGELWGHKEIFLSLQRNYYEYLKKIWTMDLWFDYYINSEWY